MRNSCKNTRAFASSSYEWEILAIAKNWYINYVHNQKLEILLLFDFLLLSKS